MELFLNDHETRPTPVTVIRDRETHRAVHAQGFGLHKFTCALQSASVNHPTGKAELNVQHSKSLPYSAVNSWNHCRS